MKEILLPVRVKKELAKTFKVESHTLNTFLQYVSNSPKAKMLRAAALQRGGLIYTGQKVPAGWSPDCDTRHENGKMIQRFGDRIQLVTNLETGTAVVTIDEKDTYTFKGLTVEHWGNALYVLQNIYNRLNS